MQSWQTTLSSPRWSIQELRRPRGEKIKIEKILHNRGIQVVWRDEQDE